MANNINDPQPPPRPVTGRTPAWELVLRDVATLPGFSKLTIQDMRDRHAAGTAKYGVPLTAGDGRDHMVDAYQEILDHVVYLRQELDELDVVINVPGEAPATGTHGFRVAGLYVQALAQAEETRQTIAMRNAARDAADLQPVIDKLFERPSK